MLPQLDVTCPYCGETFAALVDTGAGDAEYVQDCEICCHPIRFRISVDPDGTTRVDAGREDE